MESVYLTEGKGLTSSSANYLANLSKEQLKETKAKLKHLSFVDKSVELINGNKKALRFGCGDPKALEGYLEKIAEMHSFNAWIREAIKAKEALLNNLILIDVYKYCEIKGIELPEAPEKSNTISERTIIDEMDIKTRNRYLELEAYASTFGEYIHPDGRIADAREDMLERIELPNEVDGEGRDMVIYSYTPSADPELVNEVYLSLQNRYRDYEKQLNAIKFNIKEQVNKRTLEANAKYREEQIKYNDAMDIIRHDLRTYLTEERERISNLKIVIPERLQKTYEYLESLGK